MNLKAQAVGLFHHPCFAPPPGAATGRYSPAYRPDRRHSASGHTPVRTTGRQARHGAHTPLRTTDSRHAAHHYGGSSIFDDLRRALGDREVAKARQRMDSGGISSRKRVLTIIGRRPAGKCGAGGNGLVIRWRRH